jgi:outer membrane PBP1 activator LpoA protein
LRIDEAEFRQRQEELVEALEQQGATRVRLATDNSWLQLSVRVVLTDGEDLERIRSVIASFNASHPHLPTARLTSYQFARPNHLQPFR